MLDKHVLVVDPQGALPGVMKELAGLGYQITWVPSLGAATDFIASNPILSLVVASATAVQTGGESFLTAMEDLEPGVPVVWGVRAGAEGAGSRNSMPHGTIREPYRADEVRHVASRLLCEHFYPRELTEALSLSVLEALGAYGAFSLLGRPYLKANHTVLEDLCAIIPFHGSVSGHLLVGVSIGDTRLLLRRALSGDGTATMDRLEDLVGELANQILGRINTTFTSRDLEVAQMTPVFLRCGGGVLRYPGRQPSYAAQFGDDGPTVHVEYYVEELDPTLLARRVPSDIAGLGEIRYL